MDLDSDVSRSLSRGYEAGERALLDPSLWRDLARTALAPQVLWRAVPIFVAMVVAIALSARWLPAALAWAVPLAFALWLWPPVLRWFIGAVADHALTSVATDHGLAPQPLPPESTYRAWWRPALICGAMHGPLQWLGLSDNSLALLLVLAVQVVVMSPALVRSLLSPWLPIERIDLALRAEPTAWRLFTAVGLVSLVAARAIAAQMGGFDSDNFFGAFSAVGGIAFVGALAKLALVSAVGVFIAVFGTAALARMAIERVLDGDGHADGATLPAVADDAVPLPLPVHPAPRGMDSARSRKLAGGALVAAITLAVLVAALPVRLRQAATVLMLRDDIAAARADGEWASESLVQGARNRYACNGNNFKLRVMHWGGIDSLGGEDDRAVACAARHGQLSTVKLLLGYGDSPMALRHDPRFKDPSALLSPIEQALQNEAGLPAAEYLLARHDGAHVQRPSQGLIDGVQAAALSNCLACVEWAVRHSAPVDGTSQATPMALWLDNAGRGSHEVANLQHLQVLGLSAAAIGDDGRSALHAAANNGDLDSVNWLLAQGADPTRADRDGNMPVHYAAGRLGFGPDNRRIGQGDPADRERVQVVQRLLTVAPSTERGASHREHHVVLAKVSPYVDEAIDFDAAIEAYPALQQARGPSLSDLVNPS